MDKAKFVKQLRNTAEALGPLIQHSSLGSATWDGNQYVKNEEATRPDPFALSWWSRLHTIADLIEAQELPLSPNQTAYLDRVLFGGMGGLQDLCFDSTSVNKALDANRQALAIAFRN